MSFPFHPDSKFTAEILLMLITLAPVLIASVLGWFSSAPEDAGAIRVGNPLQNSAAGFEHDPAHEPVLHLSRTVTTDELRGLALGLRNAPVEQAAPLLKHFMQSTDPELALFSQSILQQGRENLQSALNQLQNHNDPTDPRVAASLLETSLRLASPSLAAPGERDGRLQHLAKKAGEILASCVHTPRLQTVCARIFLAAGDPAKADSVAKAMPADSELRRALDPEIRFAMNTKAASETC